MSRGQSLGRVPARLLDRRRIGWRDAGEHAPDRRDLRATRAGGEHFDGVGASSRQGSVAAEPAAVDFQGLLGRLASGTQHEEPRRGEAGTERSFDRHRRARLDPEHLTIVVDGFLQRGSCVGVQWDQAFGVAFAEAMSMEVPVIASRISPITEIIVDGRTGVLAEVGNPQAFARASAPLLEHPELRQRMGQAGRRHVIERFEQALMCTAYEQLFLECRAR